MIKKIFQLFQTTPAVESTSAISKTDNAVSEEQPEQALDTTPIEIVAAPEPSIPLLFPIGHFYSPIADPVDITARADQIWNKVDTM